MRKWPQFASERRLKILHAALTRSRRRRVMAMLQAGSISVPPAAHPRAAPVEVEIEMPIALLAQTLTLLNGDVRGLPNG